MKCRCGNNLEGSEPAATVELLDRSGRPYSRHTLECSACGKVFDHAVYPAGTSFAGAGPIPKMTKATRRAERAAQMVKAGMTPQLIQREPMETRPKVTSSDVKAALLLRYPSESHATMFEVAPSTGGGTRYADALVFGLWASHGHTIDGFEIKVSRGDFLSEMKKPEKSQPVFQYCNRWWLACPKDMVKPDELPPTWGMLELLDNGTLKVKVAAPKLVPETLSRGFIAAMVRRGAPDSAVIAARVARETQEARERLRKEFEDTRRTNISHRHEMALDAVKRLDALKEKTGIDFADYRHDDAWFAAVEHLHQLGERYGKGSLSALRTSLAGCIEVLDKSPLLNPMSAVDTGNHCR